jgi:hypothetical protein
MRSGKTFAAQYLSDKHGFQVHRFAGPLKDDIRAMDFPEAAIEAKPAWMRLLMQAYGQARRAVNPDHWVDQLVRDIRNVRCLQLTGDWEIPGIVIDDMRFDNEARALRALDPNEYDVRLIRLYRVGDPGDVSHTSDVSECDLDHYESWDAIMQIEAGDTFGLTFSVAEYLKLEHKV